MPNWVPQSPTWLCLNTWKKYGGSRIPARNSEIMYHTRSQIPLEIIITPTYYLGITYFQVSSIRHTPTNYARHVRPQLIQSLYYSMDIIRITTCRCEKQHRALYCWAAACHVYRKYPFPYYSSSIKIATYQVQYKKQYSCSVHRKKCRHTTCHQRTRNTTGSTEQCRQSMHHTYMILCLTPHRRLLLSVIDNAPARLLKSSRAALQRAQNTVLIPLELPARYRGQTYLEIKWHVFSRGRYKG